MGNWRCCFCLVQKKSKEKKRKVIEPHFYPKLQDYIQQYCPNRSILDSDVICKKCYTGILQCTGALSGRTTATEFCRRTSQKLNQGKKMTIFLSHIYNIYTKYTILV